MRGHNYFLQTRTIAIATAILLAITMAACKPPRVWVVAAHMKMGKVCEVTKAYAYPAQLTGVHRGDVVVWTIYNECGAEYRATVVPSSDDPFDKLCVRQTSLLATGGVSSIGCFVTGKKRKDPYKYAIFASKSATPNTESVIDRAELEIQVWP